MFRKVAMIFQDENGNYSVWYPEKMLSDYRYEELMLEYDTDGSSISGTAEQVSQELFGVCCK